MRKFINDKRNLIVIIIVVVVFLISIGSLVYINIKRMDKPENKTMNALMNVTVYGTTLEDTDIYKKANINSKVLYTIPSNEEFSVLSSNNFTDDLGNTFTKIIYTASDGKIYTGYVDNTKIKIIDEDTDFEEEESNNSNSEQTQYTVTFDTDGGSSIEAQNIDISGKVQKPVDPKKTGYTFLGWTLDGNNYDFNSEVNSDITLKASWKPLQYKVTFDTDGGNEIAKQVVNYGETVKQPANPTKSGNKFASWTLGGKVFDFSTKVTKDINLKATYKYDFTNISRCNSSANLVVSTSKYSLYRCIRDYNRDYTSDGESISYNTRMSQNIAVTKDNVYISYPINGAWRSSSTEENLKKISTNFVHKISKNSDYFDLKTINVQYGGHAQSFDVVSKEKEADVLYYNAYPYMHNSDLGYGANSLGFAYARFNESSGSGKVTTSGSLVPDRAIILSAKGKYAGAYDKNNYKINNIKKAVSSVKNGKDSNINLQLAVDEKNDRIAFVQGYTVYLHKLSSLQGKSSSSLIATMSLYDPTATKQVYNGTQGVELYGNYMYFWNDVIENGKRVGKFRLLVYKINKTSKKNNIIYSLSKYNEIDIKLNEYYSDSNKKTETVCEKKVNSKRKEDEYVMTKKLSCEAEGMSIYNGNIYLAVACRQDANYNSKLRTFGSDESCKEALPKKIANLDIYQLKKNN